MKFAITTKDRDLISEHLSLKEARDAFLPYYKRKGGELLLQLTDEGEMQELPEATWERLNEFFQKFDRAKREIIKVDMVINN